MDDIVRTKPLMAAQLPQWDTGTIKWFDRQRRYGFIYFDDPVGAHDQAFLPWLRVQESNIHETALKQGVRVRFTWIASEREDGRPEVVRLVLVDRRR